jgi:hypothetical protein
MAGKSGRPGRAWEAADRTLPVAARVGYHRPVTRLLARAAPLYFALSTAFLVWPLYPWLGDRIEPRVLGLPWSLAYVLAVIAANTAVLTGLYLGRVVDAREDGEEDGPRG